MSKLTPSDEQSLINAIAIRDGTGRELATRFGVNIPFLKAFTQEHLDQIILIREQWNEAEEQSQEPTPKDLDDLWISKKVERISRYQQVCELLFDEIMTGSRDAATLREYRSYSAYVANELGQLLHRGSGESKDETLNVDFEGIDINNLR